MHSEIVKICTDCDQECEKVEFESEEIFHDPGAHDGVGFRTITVEGSDCCGAEVEEKEIKEELYEEARS